MNYMKINVLVIGGGTHHNALGVIRTLGISGYGVELITIGNLVKNYIASSKYILKHCALADIKELAAYLCTANLNQKKKLLFRVLMQLLNI